MGRNRHKPRSEASKERRRLKRLAARKRKQSGQLSLNCAHVFQEQPRATKPLSELSVERYRKLEDPATPTFVKVLPTITAEQASAFYATREWRQLRDAVLQKYGRVCMACGETELPCRVDHIKPLRLHWELRLSFNNMQVLCVECNRLKGNWAETDYRAQSRYIRKYRSNGGVSYEGALEAHMQQKATLAKRRLD